MDLLSALQTWIFVIYAQFAPYNELEPGMVIKFVDSEKSKPEIMITVEEANLENLTWKFSCKRANSNNTDYMLVKSINDKMYLTALGNGSSPEDIQLPVLLNIANHFPDGLALNSSSDYRLRLSTTSKTKLSIPKNKKVVQIQCEKRVFQENNFFITTYSNEDFSLMKVEFKDEPASINYSFVKE